MNLDLLIFGLILALTITSTTSIALLVAWRRTSKRNEYLEARFLQTPVPAGDGSLVTAQLEAMAGQIDRLAEGQEFLSHLLAERPPVPVADASLEARVPTPH